MRLSIVLESLRLHKIVITSAWVNYHVIVNDIKILIERNLLKLAKVGAGASGENLGRLLRKLWLDLVLVRLAILAHMVADRL